MNNTESLTDTANLNQADMLDNEYLDGLPTSTNEHAFVQGMFTAEENHPKLFGHLFH